MKTLRKIYLNVLFWQCVCFYCFAQTVKIDSLQNALQKSQTDTNRVNTLIRISDYYRTSNPPKAKKYIDDAEKLAEKLSFYRGTAKTHMRRATLYNAMGKSDSALYELSKAREIAREWKFPHFEGEGYNRQAYIEFRQKKYSDAIGSFRLGTDAYLKANNMIGVVECYRGIGTVYSALGQYEESVKYYYRAIEYAEKKGNPDYIGDCYIVMGNTFQQQENHTKSRECFQKALEAYTKSGNNFNVSGAYLSLGDSYFLMKQYGKARENYQKCLKIREQIDDKKGICVALQSLGNIEQQTGNYDSAGEYYAKGLKMAEELKDPYLLCATYHNLGNNAMAKDRNEEAETYFLQSLSLSRQYNFVSFKKDVYSSLSALYFKSEKFREAFLYKDSLMKLNDSLVFSEQAGRAEELEARYNSEKKEKEIIHLNELQEQKNRIIYIVSAGLIILVVLAVFLIKNNREKREANLKLAAQHIVIAEKNKDITDSIQYARKIQKSVMPDEQLLAKASKGYFLLNKPRDIVSGDFFWAAEKNGKFFFAVADCTGHGVPGALVSIVGIHQLNAILEKYEGVSTSFVLEALHRQIRLALNKDASHGESNDGMDIGLICIDPDERLARFSGASRPLYYINKEGFHALRGDRYSVAGVKTDQDPPYTEHLISLHGNVKFYLTSDGYADQFGHKTGKKLMTKKLQQLIEETSVYPIAEQGIKLSQFFDDWKGASGQVDDVMIVGFSVEA
ncbi:MAG: hypothetical protein Fur0041_20590 [Bacteroidia bacterium]